MLTLTQKGLRKLKQLWRQFNLVERFTYSLAATVVIVILLFGVQCDFYVGKRGVTDFAMQYHIEWVDYGQGQSKDQSNTYKPPID